MNIKQLLTPIDPSYLYLDFFTKYNKKVLENYLYIDDYLEIYSLNGIDNYISDTIISVIEELIKAHHTFYKNYLLTYNEDINETVNNFFYDKDPLSNSILTDSYYFNVYYFKKESVLSKYLCEKLQTDIENLDKIHPFLYLLNDKFIYIEISNEIINDDYLNLNPLTLKTETPTEEIELSEQEYNKLMIKPLLENLTTIITPNDTKKDYLNLIILDTLYHHPEKPLKDYSKAFYKKYLVDQIQDKTENHKFTLKDVDEFSKMNIYTVYDETLAKELIKKYDGKEISPLQKTNYLKKGYLIITKEPVDL